jgi:hypothetical protein
VSYISLGDERFEKIIRDYELGGHVELTRDQLSELMDRAPDGALFVPHDRQARTLALVLHNLLLQLTKGSAYIIAKNSFDKNGFDTLRRLRSQFAATVRQTMFSTIQ